MADPLKILVVEDSPADFLLLERYLREHGIAAACRRVASYDELGAALAEQWDVVLSDYNIPDMDFSATLKRLRAHQAELPVILVSGTIGEEMAVNLLRLGLTDCVLKDRLARLPVAIRRALEDVSEHRARRAGEEAFRLERERKQMYLDTVQTLMVALDANGRITMINRAGCHLLGYEESELLGRQWFETCLPQPQGMTEVFPAFLRIMGGDLASAEYFENPVRCRDGTERLIAWRNAYTADPGGHVTGTLSSGEDITERKLTEAALRDREFKLEAIVGYSPSALSLKHPDGRYALANPNFQRIHRLSEAQIIGKTDFDLYPEEAARRFRANDEAVLRSMGRHSVEEVVPVDGEPRTYMSHMFPVLDAFGAAQFICRISLDITESKKAQEALKDSESRFRLIAESAADWVFWIGADGCFRYVSPACEQITGYAPEAFMAEPRLMVNIIHPDDRALYRQHLADAPHTDEGDLDFRIVHKDGTVRWIGHHCRAIHGENGEYLGQRGSNRDITARKAAEAERYLFSEALRQSSQALVVTDPQVRITYINPAFSRLFCYELDELKGTPINLLVPPTEEEYRRHEAISRQVQTAGPWSGELVRVARGGALIPVMANVAVIRDSDGNQLGIVGSYVNLRPLRESEATVRKLAQAVEQSPESILITNLDAEIEYVNDTLSGLVVTGGKN